MRGDAARGERRKAGDAAPTELDLKHAFWRLTASCTFFIPRQDSGCTVLGQSSRCRKPGQGFTVVLKHLKRGKKKSYCRQKSPLPVPTSLQLNLTWLWSSPAKASSGKHESPRAEAQEAQLHCTNPPRSAPKRARPALMLQSHFSHWLKSKFRKGREKAAPARGSGAQPPSCSPLLETKASSFVLQLCASRTWLLGAVGH